MADSKNKKKKENTTNLLELIFDLLLGGSDARKRNAELKLIYKHLLAKGYKYIKRDQLQPVFADFIYSIYNQTATSREVLNRFSSQDSLAYAVLLSVVPHHISDMILHVDPNEIRMRSQSMKSADLIQEIKKILLEIKKYFAPQILEKANEAYATVFTYRAFCMYDYFLLLRYFNSNLKENDFSQKTKFGTAYATSVAELVADLETALRNFLLASDWETLNNFFKSIGAKNVISQDDHAVMYQIITHLENDHVIENLCKLGMRDPSYQINPALPPKSKMQNVLNTIFHDAENTVKEIFQEQKKAQVAAIVKSLFPPEKQLTLTFYDPKKNEALGQKKLGQFEYAEPIGYLHAYFTEDVCLKLKKFADTLTIKGKSSEISFMKTFFQTSSDFSGISDGIEKLELKAATTSSIGYRIDQALRHNDDSYMDMDHVKRDVETLNSEASILMRKSQNMLPVFKDMLAKLAIDAEKGRGEILENWTEIDSLNGMNSFEYLTEFSAKTSKMNSLISLFMTH